MRVVFVRRASTGGSLGAGVEGAPGVADVADADAGGEATSLAASIATGPASRTAGLVSLRLHAATSRRKSTRRTIEDGA